MLGWALIQYGRLDTPPLVWMQNYKQPHEPHVCSDNVSWCDEVWRLPGLLLLHAVHCSMLTDTDLIAASVNYSVVVTVIPTKYSIYRV